MANKKRQKAAPAVLNARRVTLARAELDEQAANSIYMEFIARQSALVTLCQGQIKAWSERLRAAKAINN